MILFNNIVKKKFHASEEIFEQGLSIYEVIRIFKGKPIFFKDNLFRLNNSLKKSNIEIEVESLNLLDKLNSLIQLRQIVEGNLKYVLHFTKDKMDEYLFEIPYSYPTSLEYENGVSTITYQATRKNPNVKYINADLRNSTNKLIEENNAYEVLLIDNEGFITEGSRSNVFFIKGETLYTSPLKYVLSGTSRKRVIDICKEHKITIIEQRISYDKINQYDVAFLTGTSPLILPIKQINTVNYLTNNSFLNKLMKYYFTLLEKE